MAHFIRWNIATANGTTPAGNDTGNDHQPQATEDANNEDADANGTNDSNDDDDDHSHQN
jgi:hypothetical protein